MITVTDAQLLMGMTTGARCVDQDGDSTPNVIYFGYVRPDGSWFIMQQTSSLTATMSWRFVKGESDYATNWAARTSLSGWDLPKS